MYCLRFMAVIFECLCDSCQFDYTNYIQSEKAEVSPHYLNSQRNRMTLNVYVINENLPFCK